MHKRRRKQSPVVQLVGNKPKTKKTSKEDPGPGFLMDLGPSNSLRGVGLIQLLGNPKSKGQECRAHDKLR
jgi:hypothetical protein